MLDGEIYKHGWHLSKISGLCRLKDRHPDMNELKFYCYDIVDLDKTFSERLDILNQIRKELKITHKINVIEHVDVCGYDNIIKLTIICV